MSPRKPPLRLLQIASSSEIGGAEQLMLNFIRYSDSERVVPYLLALTGRGPLARLADQAGTEGQNWALSSVTDPRLMRRMQLYLRRRQYDLVQCYGLRAELITRWVAHGMQKKLISSIVSINPQRGWAHYALDRLTMDGVTAWMSTSEAAKRAYVQNVGAPADKIFVIPTGIGDAPPLTSEDREKARRKLKLAVNDGPILAVLANLRAAKGHGDLIEAIAELKPHYPKLICLCAGRDDSNGAIPKLAQTRGVADNMRWLGFVSDAARTVYPAADLALLPSHWEGMPHALIEALRTGIPSIATDVGGNSEVVRHEREGLLIPARSPREFAAAIRRAMGDEPARQAWGESARRRFESDFRVEQMAARMMDFYEFIAERGPRPSGKS